VIFDLLIIKVKRWVAKIRVGCCGCEKSSKEKVKGQKKGTE
jgi:hypothetical protein